ncbi:hypothetical protein DKM44_10200 [Deinococcus irradiatisoli]|uniref:Uncharacterized protein n=2 Tax=Deinococcus irradiatisoli TaxID=2202254 RepID=A0A2Z3JIX2_9DEIO|nr:hypothetical protein DKM44_10200 [Deinococcus irradiatisoli]
MTFTLPRFGRRSASLATAPVLPEPPLSERPAATQDVLMEVVLPAGQRLPSIPGWTLRLWPYAVLGDATLQAHPTDAQATLGSLTDALHAQGVTTLGLQRRRAA